MSLEQKNKYKIPEYIKKIKDREGQVLVLLRDVRDCVALLKPVLKNQGLDAILKVVEEGEWSIQDKVDPIKTEVEINYNIDLSQAKCIISQYRRDSEGGCQSCNYINSYMPCQDEHVTYCSLYEKAGVVGEGSSPRIAQFSKTGCADKEPRLKRKLEEVLEGQG